MTLVLELTPQQEQRLAAEAAQQGMDTASYAKILLFDRNQDDHEALEEPWSGASLVAHWEREGVIGSRPDIADSLEHARAIRQRAERRVHERSRG